VVARPEVSPVSGGGEAVAAGLQLLRFRRGAGESGKGAREGSVNGGGGGVCFRAREDGGCLNRWLGTKRQFTFAKSMHGHGMGTTWAR
jgi:hypothetical protein